MVVASWDKLTAAHKEKMKRLYTEEGLSIQKIAQRFNCSWCTAAASIRGSKKGTKEYKELGELQAKARKKLKEGGII